MAVAQTTRVGGPYSADAADVLRDLDSDAELGLAARVAEARLVGSGRNELVEASRPAAWRSLLAQVSSPLVLLLIVAATVSFGMWAYQRDSSWPYESLAILSIVVLNALMGYLQQQRAEQALAALKALVAPRARVVRDGADLDVASADIVPGDLVLIEAGDTVPADARLLDCVALQTQEAALTGESVPVSKDLAQLPPETEVADRTNMVFSGTAVVSGRGRAVVTATGMDTEVGQIAELVQRAREQQTPLQRELDRLGKVLGAAVTVIAVAMVVTLLVVNEARGIDAVFDALILGVALAVAAVPEGLPAIVTAVLALGVQRMARRHAIVRHLAAIETLGSATVIASDKTGTLTRNEMTVRTLTTASGTVGFDGIGYTPEGTMEYGGSVSDALRTEVERALSAARCANNATLHEDGGRWTASGDPTEAALIVASRKAGIDDAALVSRWPRVAEVPFSSERKLMSTVHLDRDRPDRLLVVTKGAPDVLLARCAHELVGDSVEPLGTERREELLAANDALADRALRTIGIAVRNIASEAIEPELYENLEHDLVLLGIVGMIDPPRAEARPAVVLAAEAGIRSIMITGDHPRTASVIAQYVGISRGADVLTGADLQGMTDQELDHATTDVDVYARVNPADKLRIVRSLQRNGSVVAMTGDGVNDAPALRTADIGVAMGVTGTDVSREAADLVLADDNFATIVAAVEEGRAIYLNIRKFLRYLLSSNIGEVLVMFLGVVLAKPIGLTADDDGIALPLLATQILWVNLVTDGAPALALGLDPASPRTMHRPPRRQDVGVLTGTMWRGVVVVGLVTAVGTLLVLDASLPGGMLGGDSSETHARTMAFTTLVLFSLFNVFNARSDDRTAFADLFTNRWVWIAIAGSAVLQVAVVHLPLLQDAFSTTDLSLADWALCCSVASSVLWLRELDKLVAGAARREGRS